MLLTKEEIERITQGIRIIGWASNDADRAIAKAQLKKVDDMGLLRHDSDAYGHCKPDCRACKSLIEKVR